MNAPNGSSRSSSDNPSQIALKVPVIISQLMFSSVIAVSIRPAASAITPDSASWAYICSPLGSSTMKPLIRFSAVRGTSAPVNGS